MSRGSDSKVPLPPSYAESLNYPQVGCVPPSQPQSIFTYSGEPSAPPPPLNESSEPTATPSYPQSGHDTEYTSQTFSQYGTPAAGFSSYSQNYGPSPAAPVQAGYQSALPYGPPAAAAYSTVQGTPNTYPVVQSTPTGYTTTPLAYGTTSTFASRSRQKKIAVLVCVFILVIVIIMVIFFTMFLS